MREAFTFFASYRTATAKLDDATRLAVYDALMDYALFDVEPEFDNVVVEAIFNLVRPTIDANNRKRDGGSKGGSGKLSVSVEEASDKDKASMTQASSKDSASMVQAYNKDTATDIVMTKDKDKDIDIDKDSLPPSIPPVGDKGRGRKQKASLSPESSPAFMRFWEVYPRKDSRQGAFEAWQNLNPSKELANKIIAHVLQRKILFEWTKSKGQYVPFASSFLSHRRWEDDLSGKTRYDPGNSALNYEMHEGEPSITWADLDSPLEAT